MVTDTNSRSTEIIIVTGLKDSPNITLHQKDMHIIFKFSNITSDARSRRKRNVLEKHASLEHFNDDDLQRVKDIIIQHQALCHEKKHDKVCKELIMKLTSIIQHSEEVQPTNREVLINKETKINMNHPDEVIISADVSKREAQSIDKMRGVLNKGPLPVVPLDRHPANAHGHMGVPSKITDTCLLAKLLKQNYPHVHGRIYFFNCV